MQKTGTRSLCDLNMKRLTMRRGEEAHEREIAKPSHDFGYKYKHNTLVFGLLHIPNAIFIILQWLNLNNSHEHYSQPYDGWKYTCNGGRYGRGDGRGGAGDDVEDWVCNSVNITKYHNTVKYCSRMKLHRERVRVCFGNGNICGYTLCNVSECCLRNDVWYNIHFDGLRTITMWHFDQPIFALAHDYSVEQKRKWLNARNVCSVNLAHY